MTAGRLRLSIAQVELPDGVQFEQYVLWMPKAAMTVLLDDTGERVLMRHRFVQDCWTLELPGGYVDPDEDSAVTAAREVEEETGSRPRLMTPLTRFQPNARNGEPGVVGDHHRTTGPAFRPASSLLAGCVVAPRRLRGRRQTGNEAA